MKPVRFGVCTNFLGEDRYSLHTEELAELSGIFEYVELPAMTVAEANDAVYGQLRDTVLQNGICCETMTNLFPAHFRLLSPDFDLRELRAYLDLLLPRCRDLGCQKLIFGSGKARSLLAGQSAEESFQILAERLNSLVIPLAEDFGIRIVLEPLNPEICNFILTLNEGAVLCERCGGKMSLLADSLHLMKQPGISKELEENRKTIEHIHISELGRRAPINGTSPELSDFLRGVKATGYEGNISFECRFSGAEEMLACKRNIARLWDEL